MASFGWAGGLGLVFELEMGFGGFVWKCDVRASLGSFCAKCGGGGFVQGCAGSGARDLNCAGGVTGFAMAGHMASYREG